jgi:acyl-CoA reductase-like NAD-dependent aldehyde dehydrogenase
VTLSSATAQGASTWVLNYNTSVHESVADRFVQGIQKEMLNVHAGSSANPGDNRLRGVFTDAHASHVVELVKDAIEKGAKVVVGDSNRAGEYGGGNIVQPIILDHIVPGMGALLFSVTRAYPFAWSLSDALASPLARPIDMASQEIFGPAVGITRFESDAEAICVANKLEYGLSGAVHSRDVARAAKLAKQLEINLVHINSFTMHDNAVRCLANHGHCYFCS